MTQTAAETIDYRDIPGHSSAPAKRSLWLGRILKGIPLLFLAFDTALKLLEAAPAVQGTVELGYPASAVRVVGVIELVCVVACLVPRTAILGAMLTTGYLGGAIATHVRLDNPLFSHTLFPVYVAGLLWAGLWLNDANLRRVLPFTSSK